MPTSRKENIPEGELAQQAFDYTEDCVAAGQTRIKLEMTKNPASGTWTLECS